MHCIALYLHMLRIGKYERRSLEVSDKEDNHLELTSCIYSFEAKINAYRVWRLQVIS